MTLRALILVVAIFGGALGWFASTLRSARRQHDAVVVVLSHFGTVDYGQEIRLAPGTRLQMKPKPRHAWLRKRLGDDLFDSVTNVTFFRQQGVDDTTMAVLDAFPALEELHVSKAPVTDHGFTHLAGRTKLRRIAISEAPITDATLLSIASLPRVMSLDLNRTRITDAGLVALDAMPQLRTLDLEWSQVTDAGMVHLVGLKRLQFLQLSCTEISDDGLKFLRDLTSLKYLSISATRVTPEGKDSIAAALPGCSVTWWSRNGRLSEAGGRPEIPKPKQ